MYSHRYGRTTAVYTSLRRCMNILCVCVCVCVCMCVCVCVGNVCVGLGLVVDRVVGRSDVAVVQCRVQADRPR